MSRPRCPSANENPRGSCRATVCRQGFVLAILLLIFFPWIVLRAQSTPLPMLTTTHQVHALPINEAARSYPVSVRGVVTYYDPYIDARRPAFFIADNSGSIFVSLSEVPATMLKPGELVEVTGVSAAGDFAPVLGRASVRRIGFAPLPSAARRVSAAEMLTSVNDGQWVEVEGVVYAVRRSGPDVILDLFTGGGTTFATTIAESGTDYAGLIDAKVAVRGNEAPLFNHHGQITGTHLLFPGLSTLRVEEAASTDPFDAPLEEASNLLRYTPGVALNHRVHLRGTVTMLWPRRMICVEDSSHGICADTRQSEGLSPGDRVDLVGFPAVGKFTPTLVHANYRAAVGHQASPPLVLTAEEAMHGLHDAELVSVEGRLIGHDRTASDPTIVLSSGKVVFSAVMPSGSIAPEVEDGSLVTVTGICSLESNAAETIDFPVARSMRILLRSPADIVMIRAPSWWNAQHTLMVLAVALVSTVAALVFALSLWRRVKGQTLLLKKSEEQFRQLASQDGLTRLPNRNAILKVLSASLESARSQRGVCVAIVDLDHFKQINDNYGHLAGDEVLRQAASRLSSTIRVSDAIGRLGGEEFLIVLRDVDCRIGVERCESIRNAMGCEPVTFDDHALRVTCSIGVAYTDGNAAMPTSLIALADEALYRAKVAGRNRVELFLPEMNDRVGEGPRTHSLTAPL